MDNKALKYVLNAKRFSDISTIPIEQLKHKTAHYTLSNGLGIKALEDITGGLDEGTIDLIGGSSGVGKSTIALSMASVLSQQGKAVLYISTELDEFDVARMLLYTDKKAYLNVSFLPLDTINLQEIEEATMEAINANYDVILFDYINSATMIDGNRSIPQDQVSSVFLQKIRSSLKHTVYKPHMIFFTQLTRNAYSQCPDNTVVQGSASTCNKVDFAMNMIRPNQYIRDLFNTGWKRIPNVVAYVYKNRWNEKSDCLIGLELDHYFMTATSIGIIENPDWKAILKENNKK